MTQTGTDSMDDTGDGNMLAFIKDRVIVRDTSGFFFKLQRVGSCYQPFLNPDGPFAKRWAPAAAFASFKEPGAEAHNVHEICNTAASDLDILYETQVEFPLDSFVDCRNEQFGHVQPLLHRKRAS